MSNTPSPLEVPSRITKRSTAGSKRLAEGADPEALARVTARVEARKPIVDALLAAARALPAGHTEDDLVSTFRTALQDAPAELHEECLRTARRQYVPARAAKDKPIPYPGLCPKNLQPQNPPPCPPFPALGLDHPAVRREWEDAHRFAEMDRYMLRPEVLNAWAEHYLQAARYDAQQRGRKDSGDNRRSVARDFLQDTRAELRARHEGSLRRHLEMIQTIASGDAEVHQGEAIEGSHHVYRIGEDDARIDWNRTEWGTDGIEVRSRSKREREEADRAARKAERAAMTPEEDAARFDAWVAEVMAEPILRPEEPDLSGMFDMPDDPDDWSPQLIDSMIAYVGKATDIAQKKFERQMTKVRTAQRKEADAADPEAAKAAKLDKARSKGKDREARRNASMTPEQRKERERLKKQRQRAAKAGKV